MAELFDVPRRLNDYGEVLVLTGALKIHVSAVQFRPWRQ